ncbi:MAG: dTDP-4-dehydrorhamnose 3,5-epimerase family protein [Proteobacteria bacterium]|nr:dTDP-4-dehydrorhamnose 3,5-epimerase family protein [Pseudomonadota bacterium]
MIDGVIVTPLRQIHDERGKVMHMLRADQPQFAGFGEIYFSTVWPGAIKGWHLHRRMVLSYAVPVGLIKLVLYDEREESASRGALMELFLGPESYSLVTIPPLVWNGFKGLGSGQSVVANCASIPHDPDEIERRDPFDPRIPYDWAIKHR